MEGVARVCVSCAGDLCSERALQEELDELEDELESYLSIGETEVGITEVRQGGDSRSWRRGGAPCMRNGKKRGNRTDEASKLP